MATVTIRETFTVDGVLTDMDSVKLSDPGGTYGVKRNDTAAVVVADGTDITNTAVGTYSYTFTSPADDLIFTAWIEWSFAGITDQRYERTIVGPLSSASGLITLAELKTYLNITDAAHDAQLNQAISSAESEADAYCNRTLLSTDYTSWLDGPGDSLMLLPNYPLTAVSRVSVYEVDAMSIKCAASDATQATVSVAASALILFIADGASAGTTSLAFATYPTLADLETIIEATAGSWSVEIPPAYSLFQSSVLRPVGGLFAKDIWAQVQMPDQPESGYRVLFDEGSILAKWGGFPHGKQNVYVAYTAGYTNGTAPDALKQVIMEMAGSVFYAGEHDITLKSEKLGDYSWTAADDAGAYGANLSARFGGKLAPFRKHTY